MAGAIKQFYQQSGSNSGGNPVLDIIQIGTAGFQVSDVIPFYSYWERGRSAMIFSPTEIGKAGVIQAIELGMSGPASPTTHTAIKQTIYMGHFPISTYPNLQFPSGTVQWDIVTNYGVTGYVRTFGAGTGADITYAMGKNDPTWTQINMGGPNLTQFNYNGTDGLIILYQNNQFPNYTSVSDAIDWYSNYSGSGSKGAYDFSYGSLSSTMNRIDYRPIIKLHVFG